MRILIIDDARFQRGQVSRALSELGHTVLEAVNGQEGFVKLLQEVPDVVFCDLLMPVMDGIGFLGMVKKHEVSTPIIILSADVQTSTREQCLQMGAQAFLNKPCNAADLAKALGAIRFQVEP